MAQLIGKDVTLGYEGNVVIEHLNFSVQAGDYLYIVGENGSGKSTLMKAILGLKSPMAGTITTGDGLQPDEIGYLPQQTAVQRDFPASVLEIVRSGCLNHSGFRPFYTKQEKQLALDNMERLGITHLAKRCYRELSGAAAAGASGTGSGGNSENAGTGRACYGAGSQGTAGAV